jgi:hypothetical protein
LKEIKGRGRRKSEKVTGDERSGRQYTGKRKYATRIKFKDVVRA